MPIRNEELEKERKKLNRNWTETSTAKIVFGVLAVVAIVLAIFSGGSLLAAGSFIFGNIFGTIGSAFASNFFLGVAVTAGLGLAVYKAPNLISGIGNAYHEHKINKINKKTQNKGKQNTEKLKDSKGQSKEQVDLKDKSMADLKILLTDIRKKVLDNKNYDIREVNKNIVAIDGIQHAFNFNFEKATQYAPGILYERNLKSVEEDIRFAIKAASEKIEAASKEGNDKTKNSEEEKLKNLQKLEKETELAIKLAKELGLHTQSYLGIGRSVNFGTLEEQVINSKEVNLEDLGDEIKELLSPGQTVKQSQGAGTPPPPYAQQTETQKPVTPQVPNETQEHTALNSLGSTNSNVKGVVGNSSLPNALPEVKNDVHTV